MPLRYEGLQKTRLIAFKMFKDKLEHGDHFGLQKLIPADFLCRIGITGVRCDNELCVTRHVAKLALDTRSLDVLMNFLHEIGSKDNQRDFDLEMANEIILWINLALPAKDVITSLRDKRLVNKCFQRKLDSRIMLVNPRLRKKRKCSMASNP